MTGKQVIERITHLKTLRSPHEWLWDEIGFLTNARYYNSKSVNGKQQSYIPHSEIYDTTLRTKSRMQANGITSMLFPRDRDWLSVKAPWQFRKNKSMKKAFREIGEGIMEHLRASNFHHINHGIITHRSQIGTGTMAMEWVENDFGTEVMNFRKFEPMRYLIDHDSRSRVTCFGAEYHWSAATAAGEWGIENLSPKLQKEARDSTKLAQDHTFYVLIEKRPKWEREGNTGNKGMLYRVMVVEADGEHVIVDSGRENFGIVASRYEVFDSPWGYSPAWEVLPDGYKANYVAKFMMVMGERAAVPPIMAPASMKDEGVGLGASEVTYVMETNPNLWPKELSGGGNFAVGMEVWKMLRDSIDEAFHGNLFHMFSRMERDRTATEILAMQGELNAQIDPTITALQQDHTDPVVQWVFHELDERGIIDVPDEARDQNTGKGIAPIFTYDNALTMNHQKAKAVEAMGIVDALVNLQAAGFPVDVVKLEETARRIWRDNGQEEDELLSEAEYQDAQEEKAQAAQEAQQMAMASEGAKAAKDASQAGIDVGQAFPQAV